MTIQDRTPILVGAGQSVHRDAAKDLERGRRPIRWTSPARPRAARSRTRGASGDLAAAIDTIAVMRLFGDSSPRRAHEHGRAANPPRSVARRIGADPANAIYVEVGGNSPQKWVNLMAERIANGEAEVVLLAGAEAIATLKRAGRAGVKLDWNEEVEGSLEDRGFGPSLLNPYEIAHGITLPHPGLSAVRAGDPPSSRSAARRSPRVDGTALRPVHRRRRRQSLRLFSEGALAARAGDARKARTRSSRCPTAD